MKLHKNEELYQEIVAAAANEFGIPESYVDKDYFVSVLLKNISGNVPNILFKGGTSLSKCFGIINRFSEDIDLNLILEENPTNREKRALKESIMQTITESEMNLVNPDDIRTRRDFNKYEVEFPRVLDPDDNLKPNIVIETFLALRSFPYEKRETTNYIFEFLKRQNDMELIETYNLEPFLINTQSIDRTFIDKILAICDYHEDKKYIQYSRHLYDIHQIWNHQEFETTSFVRLFYDIVEERRKRPQVNHSSAVGYHLLETLREIVEKESFKDDYNSNTKFLIQDEVSYEDTKKSVIEIIEKGILPEVIE